MKCCSVFLLPVMIVFPLLVSSTLVPDDARALVFLSGYSLCIHTIYIVISANRSPFKLYIWSHIHALKKH